MGNLFSGIIVLMILSSIGENIKNKINKSSNQTSDNNYKEEIDRIRKRFMEDTKEFTSREKNIQTPEKTNENSSNNSRLKQIMLDVETSMSNKKVAAKQESYSGEKLGSYVNFPKKDGRFINYLELGEDELERRGYKKSDPIVLLDMNNEKELREDLIRGIIFKEILSDRKSRRKR